MLNADGSPLLTRIVFRGGLTKVAIVLTSCVTGRESHTSSIPLTEPALPLTSSLLSEGNAESEDNINIGEIHGGTPLCRYVCKVLISVLK